MENETSRSMKGIVLMYYPKTEENKCVLSLSYLKPNMDLGLVYLPKNGKRGTNCSFPHPNMCFRFIRQGKKGCNKGASCQYAHPKLCRASLTSKRCDRRNCYYFHVAGTLRPLTDVVPPKKQVSSRPTPLMQMEVTPPSNLLPSAHRQIFIPDHAVSNLPPKSQVTIPHGPHEHAPSNESTVFLEQLKELKTQMSQLQQMHSYLFQNLIDRAWPPLAKNQTLQAPLYVNH